MRSACLKNGFMRGLRIVLDKSVVYGLNNFEVDSLDRYFFQIVPHILVDEILADLTKVADPRVTTRIAANTYRVSGNHGLTLNFRTRLADSLLGYELPMDGRFLASGETIVRTKSGSLVTVVETPLEDEILARWERGEFTSEEETWAASFRRLKERPLNFKLYVDQITNAGLSFSPPRNDNNLIAIVDELLANRKLLPNLFFILAREFGIPPDTLTRAMLRWSNEDRKGFPEFAPYAYFCMKANFLWHLGLTNPGLFQPDKNDRKDLEYCYYLPNTQVFASKDRKHHRLMPALLRSDQTLVGGDELKNDLRKISEDWDRLTTQQKIALNARRGDAPPEAQSSLVFQLWRKHDGEINPSRHSEIIDRRLVDSSLPKEEQVPFTLREFLQTKTKEIKEGERLSEVELDKLNELHKGQDPTTIRMFRSRVSQERLKKWHPQLTEADLAQENADELSQVYLDPIEYRTFMFID